MTNDSPAPDTLDPRLLLRNLTTEFKKGNFSVRMPVEQTELAGKVYDTLNEVFELNERTAHEFERISLVVGKQGKIRQRASLPGATGSWAGCMASVNTLVGDLVQPTTEVARVIGAVAKGDLTQTMGLEIEGPPLMGDPAVTGVTFPDAFFCERAVISPIPPVISLNDVRP